MDSRPKRNQKAGFTLIESLIAILVLTILMVGVFSAINKAQAHYRVENQKVDSTQEQRAFLDQFTRDLHQSGFPTLASVGPLNAAAAAQGLIPPFTSTSLTFEGDLDGTGKQTVTYDYNAACSCIRRTVGGNPSSSLENVVDPNTLPGTPPIFIGYDRSGLTTYAVNQVRSIRIGFTVQSGNEVNMMHVQTTMSGMARLPNND